VERAARVEPLEPGRGRAVALVVLVAVAVGLLIDRDILWFGTREGEGREEEETFLL
jgi:hypothetical protein